MEYLQFDLAEMKSVKKNLVRQFTFYAFESVNSRKQRREEVKIRKQKKLWKNSIHVKSNEKKSWELNRVSVSINKIVCEMMDRRFWSFDRIESVQRMI